MTKKDYILLAQIVNDFYHTSVVDGEQINKGYVENLVDLLTYKLHSNYKNFDSEKFYKACLK